MQYNPEIHHRHSIRLKNYDYSRAGMYFITICVQHKQSLFGKIENGKMILNDAGKMIEKWWEKLPAKFSNIKLNTYTIMPNHFHAIVEIIENDDKIVGANPCVCPNLRDYQNTHEYDKNKIQGRHAGLPLQKLHLILQWFKTMTTNEYIHGTKTFGWKQFYKKLWQRNYFEHIIRNEQSYQFIADYIVNNPANWINDKFYIVEE